MKGFLFLLGLHWVHVSHIATLTHTRTHLHTKGIEKEWSVALMMLYLYGVHKHTHVCVCVFVCVDWDGGNSLCYVSVVRNDPEFNRAVIM